VIAGLRGHVIAVDPAAVVVAVGPVDVLVGVPTRWALGLVAGQDIELQTYLYVRENQIALYGFATRDELQLFELLLSVSGVGPKAALNLLSTLEAAELRRAIAEDDPRTLARAPGVGMRAAARIVSDLQTKVRTAEVERFASAGDAPGEAVTALIAMGYGAAEAKRAVEGVARDGSLETVLREALRILAERPRA
jgi:Holliday junction DNA helicase RuvA